MFFLLISCGNANTHVKTVFYKVSILSANCKNYQILAPLTRTPFAFCFINIKATPS